MSAQPQDVLDGQTSSKRATEKVAAKPALVTGDLNKQILAAHEEITALNNERTELNAKFETIYTRMEGLGIRRKALKLSHKRAALSEEEQMSEDKSYLTCCAATGNPVQQEMF